MTEYELFRKHIPDVMEMVAETKRMTEAEYNAWRQECLETAPTEAVRQFTSKILQTVDCYRQKEGGTSCEEA